MPFHALVLAGRRDANDELAAATGAPHRAMLDVSGRPMLARVIATLSASSRISGVTVSIDAPDLLDGYPELAEARARGDFEVIASEPSPSRSVLAAFDRVASDWPWLVTTADHALLDASMLEHFLEAASAAGRERSADLAVGLVSRSRIEARFPGARRTYLPFRGESFSGANLFALLGPRARNAVSFWRRAESLRKQPWKLVREFGWVSLALFLARRLTLDRALERAGEVLGARVVAIPMPMAEAAVDVDKISDLELVRTILDERARADGATQASPEPPSHSHPSSTNPPLDGS